MIGSCLLRRASRGLSSESRLVYNNVCAITQQQQHPQWSSIWQSPNVPTLFRREASSEAATATVNSDSPSVEVTSDATKSTGPPPIVWTTHRLSQEQIVKVDAIFHKILWLDMFETHMLTSVVNERLGRVRLTPKQRRLLQRQMDARVLARAGGQNSAKEDAAKAQAAEEAAKPKLCDLKLVGFDEKSKIKVIKEIRSIVEGLGLKEAKELVEGAPKVIHKGIKPEMAEEYKQKLESVGAKIEIILL